MIDTGGGEGAKIPPGYFKNCRGGEITVYIMASSMALLVVSFLSISFFWLCDGKAESIII